MNTQTAFQGGTFDPNEVGDPTQSLQQSFVQQNQGARRVAAAIARNNETNIRSAGKLWGQLEELAPSARKLIETKNIEWAKDQDAKGREFLYQNPVTKEQKDAYIEELKAIGRSAEEANKIASDWEAKGGDIWTSEKFRKLSVKAQVGHYQGIIDRHVSMYNPGADPDVLNATDPTDRVAIMAAKRHEFWKQFDGLDESMVNLETREKLRAIEDNSNRAWNATRTKEIKEQRRAEMLDILKTDLKGENPAEAVLHAVRSQLGEFGGVMSESRQDIMTELVTMVENGELKRKDLHKLQGSYFEAKDGTKQKFGDYYEKEFTQIKFAQNNFLQKLFQVKKQTEEREVSTVEEGYQKEHDDTAPEERNNQWYEDRQIIHKKKYGVESALLTKLKAANSVENVRYKDEEKEIKRKVAMNILTEKDLENVDGKLVQQYTPIAQAMEKKHEVKQDNLEFLGALPGSKEFMGNAIIARDSGTIGETADLLKARYLKLSRQLDVAGVENPEQVARDRIETWFRKTADNPLSGLKTINGYDTSKLKQRPQDIKAGRGRIAPMKANERKKRNEMIAKVRALGNGAIDNPVVGPDGNVLRETAVLTEKELLDMEDGFGEAGWYPDPKVKWLSIHYDTHPIAIINRNRKALGMKPLPENRDELKRWDLESRKVKRQKAEQYLSGTDQGVCTTRFRKSGGTVWKNIKVNGQNVSKEFTYKEACPTQKDKNDLKQASKDTGISESNLLAAMFTNRTDIGNNPIDLQDPTLMAIYNSALYASGDIMGLNNSVYAGINLPRP